MNKINYNKPIKNEKPVEVEQINKEIVEEVVTETEQPVEEIKPIIEPIEGVVTDCMKLNVRELPNTDAQVLCVIKALSKVLIDETESTEDFYKVCTEAGIEGYCMKKFIAV